MTESIEPSAEDLVATKIPTGRTGWDFFTQLIEGRIFWIFAFSVLAGLALWFLWDEITSVPIYIISSIFLSWFWYAPITRWLSRSSKFIEVWEPDTGLLTTYRIGKSRFADLAREGLQNQVSSRIGSTRIFASDLNPEANLLINTWVHDCDPWSYHRDRNTLARLTKRVSEVFEDITDGEAIAQVEGRAHAMDAMRRHYADLDSLFFGDDEIPTAEVNTNGMDSTP